MKIIKKFQKNGDKVKLLQGESGYVFLSYVNQSGCAINKLTPCYEERISILKSMAVAYCEKENFKIWALV